MDQVDRRIVLATQGGLPLVPRPYDEIGEAVGCSGAEVRVRLAAMLDRGVIRRIGVVPNHYAIGYAANGMSVWDVRDEAVDLLGERLGALPFVTHCYRRPRALPEWPFNLFAMIHATTREEVLARVAEVRALLGSTCRSHEVLFSSRILKKSGMRIGAQSG